MNGTSLQLQKPYRVVRDPTDYQPVDTGPTPPVVLVGLVGGVVFLHPLHELKWSGPHRIFEEILPVFLDCRRAGDARREHRHVGEKWREARAQRKPHGQRVHDIDALDVLKRELSVFEGPGMVRVLRVDLPVVVELYRFGIERSAVVESYSAAQFERPDESVG